MASKKERKVVRREGMPSTGSEVHKLAEMEACQKLLETGCVGSRFYQGPHIAGAFFTLQDKILAEVRWAAVDAFELKKIAVSQCRLMASSVQKFWLERARGSLSGATGMIQSYWLSVEREVHASAPGVRRGSFKLGTLQGMRPDGNSVPQSSVPTPSEEEGGGFQSWVESRAMLNPPIAETTTALAEYCVEVVKQQGRQSTFSVEDDSVGDEHASLVLDMCLPVDVALDSTFDSARERAIAGAVQANLAETRGVDGGEWPAPFCSGILQSFTVDPENQRALLTEVLVTNIMSKNPHLFRLALSTGKETATTSAKKPGPRRLETATAPLPAVPNKHYFVSVIFSTFQPLPWQPVEDKVLLSQSSYSDWSLVASSVNWDTFCAVGRHWQRTAAQCQDRLSELSGAPKKVKAAAMGCFSVSIRRSVRQPEQVRLKKTVFSKTLLKSDFTLVDPKPKLVSPVPFDRRGLSGAFARSSSQIVWHPQEAAFSIEKSTTSGVVAKKAALPNNSPRKLEKKTLADLRPVVSRKNHFAGSGAFAIEEMLRKNPLAVPGMAPQYIAGSQVCAAHPSFANIGRIAEITLTRLVNSLDEQRPSISGPVSIPELFGFCSRFRSKYPAVFSSHQAPQKPFMPALRLQSSQPANKMLTRAMASEQHSLFVPAAPRQTVLPVAPNGTTEKPETKVPSPVKEEGMAAAGPAAPGWVRRPRAAANR